MILDRRFLALLALCVASCVSASTVPVKDAPASVPAPVAQKIPRELPTAPGVTKPDAHATAPNNAIPHEDVSTPNANNAKRVAPPAPPAVPNPKAETEALPALKRAVPAPPAAPAVPNPASHITRELPEVTKPDTNAEPPKNAIPHEDVSTPNANNVKRVAPPAPPAVLDPKTETKALPAADVSKPNPASHMARELPPAPEVTKPDANAEPPKNAIPHEDVSTPNANNVKRAPPAAPAVPAHPNAALPMVPKPDEIEQQEARALPVGSTASDHVVTTAPETIKDHAN